MKDFSKRMTLDDAIGWERSIEDFLDPSIKDTYVGYSLTEQIRQAIDTLYGGDTPIVSVAAAEFFGNDEFFIKPLGLGGAFRVYPRDEEGCAIVPEARG